MLLQNSLDFNCDLSHKNTNMEKKFAFNHCEDNLALKIDQNNYIEKDKKQTVVRYKFYYYNFFGN